MAETSALHRDKNELFRGDEEAKLLRGRLESTALGCRDEPNEDNAKTLWEKLKLTLLDKLKTWKIDAGNELRNLRLCEKEKISDYIARARGLATKCASLGLDVNERESAFYVLRGLTGKYAKIHEILKTQREKSIDELLETLREDETLQNNVGMPVEVLNPDLAFTAVRR
ncbi:hypothetical protein AVEN_232405-1 [Araneus ventricosus]|uniref:Retrotransposon gag domain-containing protein n=1 Tax=Araneus ventricosus TaxID=182803 RepID=A0A4Y2CUB8_ARAVE|nr:hypothetical protein AVEN_232405-1 [Araneus ventricosus]